MKKIVNFFVALMSLLFIAGCSQDLNLEGTINVKFPAENRAAREAVNPADYSYKLYVTPQNVNGQEEVVIDVTAGQTAQVTVLAGDYQISAAAYDSEGKECYKAQTDSLVTVEAGKTSDVKLIFKLVKTDEPENPDVPDEPENPAEPENPDEPEEPEAIYITLTFEADGGSGEQKAQQLELKDAAAGVEFTLPECTFTAPDSYKYFEGWALAKNADKIVKAGDKVTYSADTTLYARWATRSALELLPLTPAVEGIYAVNENEAFKVTLGKKDYSLSKDYVIYYTTDGTAPTEKSAFVEIKNGVASIPVTADSKLTAFAHDKNNCYPDSVPAVWSVKIEKAPVYVALLFDSNKGSGTQETLVDELKEGEEKVKFTLPNCTFVAPDYHYFAGWTTDLEKDELLEPGLEMEIKADTVLYARWSECTQLEFSVVTQLKDKGYTLDVGDNFVVTIDTDLFTLSNDYTVYYQVKSDTPKEFVAAQKSGKNFLIPITGNCTLIVYAHDNKKIYPDSEGKPYSINAMIKEGTVSFKIPTIDYSKNTMSLEIIPEGNNRILTVKNPEKYKEIRWYVDGVLFEGPETNNNNKTVFEVNDNKFIVYCDQLGAPATSEYYQKVITCIGIINDSDMDDCSIDVYTVQSL